MPGLGTVMWILLFAVLLGGCDTTDTRYFRYGVGSDLYSSDIAQVTQFQESYLKELCRQALPLGATPDTQCLHQSASNNWNLIVRAGMNDIDRRCDDYLSWLDDRRRTNQAVLKQFADTLVASQGVMRLAGVGVDPITMAGLAFGLAASTFTNVNSRLLLEVDKTTVQTLVLRNRDRFRLDVASKQISDRPTAVHALRLYLTICTPFAIETDINSTVTVFQQTNGAALDRSMPLVNSETVVPTLRITSVATDSTYKSLRAQLFPDGAKRPDPELAAYVLRIIGKKVAFEPILNLPEFANLRRMISACIIAHKGGRDCEDGSLQKFIR